MIKIWIVPIPTDSSRVLNATSCSKPTAPILGIEYLVEMSNLLKTMQVERWSNAAYSPVAWKCYIQQRESCDYATRSRKFEPVKPRWLLRGKHGHPGANGFRLCDAALRCRSSKAADTTRWSACCVPNSKNNTQKGKNLFLCMPWVVAWRLLVPQQCFIIRLFVRRVSLGQYIVQV